MYYCPTAETLISRTPRWTAYGMGYQGLWVVYKYSRNLVWTTGYGGLMGSPCKEIPVHRVDGPEILWGYGLSKGMDYQGLPEFRLIIW